MVPKTVNSFEGEDDELKIAKGGGEEDEIALLRKKLQRILKKQKREREIKKRKSCISKENSKQKWLGRLFKHYSNLFGV